MTGETPKAGRPPRRYNRGKDGTHPLDKAFRAKPGGVVEELGGDELQRLKVTWQDEPGFIGPDDFWRSLEETLAECDAVMLRHGWNRKAGNGRNFPDERTAEPFSELYYAGKIGHECWNFLTHHRPHDPNSVMLAQAVGLGRLLTELEWRQAFKPSIVTGRPVRAGGKLGGHMRAGNLAPDTEARLAEMDRLISDGRKVKDAAEALARRGIGKSAAANKRLWERHRDKRK